MTILVEYAFCYVKDYLEPIWMIDNWMIDCVYRRQQKLFSNVFGNRMQKWLVDKDPVGLKFTKYLTDTDTADKVARELLSHASQIHSAARSQN